MRATVLAFTYALIVCTPSTAFQPQAGDIAGCSRIGDAAVQANKPLIPDQMDKLTHRPRIWLPETIPDLAQPAPANCLVP